MTVAKGNLIVISAPSGTGKTTICRDLVKELDNCIYSISVTSRAPRSNEENGKDYFFVNKEEFRSMIEENNLLEWASVHDNYYGTSRTFVENELKKGRHVILDLDVQGGFQIKKAFPEASLIFIMPPSKDELKRRLIGRKQDSDREIEKRLQNADKEMAQAPNYDYIVVNNELKETVDKIKDIIISRETAEDI